MRRKPRTRDRKRVQKNPPPGERATRGRPRYGFKVVRGRRVVDPVEAEVIRFICAWRAAGCSFRRIQEELYQRKYVPRQGGARFALPVLRKILKRSASPESPALAEKPSSS
jgi:hypothetical protein